MSHGFWGKTSISPAGQPTAWLPLADHCIDVAVVFRQLTEQTGIHRSLVAAARCHLSSIQLDRLAVFAYLHDLGKCNWGFQARFDPNARDTAGHIREVLPLLYDDRLSEAFIEAVGLGALSSWFDNEQTLAAYLHVLLAHHGRPHPVPASEAETDRTARFWEPRGSIDPFVGITELLVKAQSAFPDAFGDDAEPLPSTIAFQHRFAGLLMLADWLGSHSEGFFPFRHTAPTRKEFADKAAAHAISAVGLDIEAFRKADPPDFQSLFGFPPNALQSLLIGHERGQTVVAESATGSGKTEAALAYFAKLFNAGAVDSLYFALPTRVAAREIYARVLAFAKRLFGEDHPPVVLAVPGYAAIDGEPYHLLPDATRQFADNLRRERSWAAERPKRFLAATIAVGTIDQALLSVMQVPHAHLRSICLDRSLLVVDEVHASDTYIHNLLRALLDHHRSIGAPSLLLSATLGSAARAELLTSRGAHADVLAFDQAQAVPYPAITSEAHAPAGLTAESVNEKQVNLDAVTALEGPVSLLPRLRDAIGQGARVLVVMNTVARAIALQRAAEQDSVLAESLFTCRGVPCPHHGRFARVDREALDAAVSGCLGKGSAAGARLLIGTQTLEQSLDIDADWLVTDLCPVDVLLQRIGRLHRHKRDRPESFQQARCTVLMPEDRSFDQFFDARGRICSVAGLGGGVYPDLRMARLTAELLDHEVDIVLPQDNRRLVEYATHPEQLERFRDGHWERHRNELLGKQFAQIQGANSAVIPPQPFDELRFGTDIEGGLATRLGVGDREVTFDRPVTSPFGHRLSEIRIPGWMVASGVEQDTPDQPVVVESGVIHLSYGGRSYQYSRDGLEKT